MVAEISAICFTSTLSGLRGNTRMIKKETEDVKGPSRNFYTENLWCGVGFCWACGLLTTWLPSCLTVRRHHTVHQLIFMKPFKELRSYREQVNPITRTSSKGWCYDSLAKGCCHQAWGPEFESMCLAGGGNWLLRLSDFHTHPSY